MRSRWPAETVILWLATATLEAAWITLANVLLQWFKHAERVDLTIVHYFAAVLLGMVLARTFRNQPQNTYAVILSAGAVGSAVLGALLSGAPTTDVGAFVRTAILDPGAWLMGFAVLRGVFQADPGSGYETERVFTLGIPALVVFWLLATVSGMTDNRDFTLQAFAATLSFISAGLLALGLGRLKDLDVDSVDRGARRRWLLLVVGIVAVVLFVGLPMSAVLGLPVTAVVLGVLGPVAPLFIALFGLMAIPVFWLLDLIVGLLRPGEVPIPSFNVPSPIGSGPPPLFEPPTGPPPDLTWLLIALVLVGAFVLLRIGRSSCRDQPSATERAMSTSVAIRSRSLCRLCRRCRVCDCPPGGPRHERRARLTSCHWPRSVQASWPAGPKRRPGSTLLGSLVRSLDAMLDDWPPTTSWTFSQAFG